MNPEQVKYQTLWGEHPDYRVISNSEGAVNDFLSIAKPQFTNTIAEFGCGTGRGSFKIKQKCGADITMFDFADNSIDDEVRASLNSRFKFKQHDLTQPIK